MVQVKEITCTFFHVVQQYIFLNSCVSFAGKTVARIYHPDHVWKSFCFHQEIGEENPPTSEKIVAFLEAKIRQLVDVKGTTNSTQRKSYKPIPEYYNNVYKSLQFAVNYLYDFELEAR